MRLAALVVGVVTTLVGLDPVSGVTINFESVPGVTPVNGFLNFTPVPPQSRLSTQLLSTHGVRFRSESPNPDFVALIKLGTNHAYSGQNGIGPCDNTPDIHYNVPLLINFFDSTDPSIKTTVDFVSLRTDRFTDHDLVTMQGFGVDGALLGTFSATDNGGSLYSLALPGIHMVRMSDPGGTVAYDDLTFEPTPFLGDLNGDHVVDNFDIAPFELALTDRNAYLSEYPALTDYARRGDINHNGAFDNFDIQFFEAFLTTHASTAVAAVPEPSGYLLASFGLVVLTAIKGQRGAARGKC